MSAFYDLYDTPNPKKDGDKKPLHARIVPKGTYDAKEFLERVARFQHLPYNVLDGALGAIVDQLADSLANGYNVELGELGYFSTTLKCSRQAMSPKQIRAESVQFYNARVRFSNTFKRKIDLEMRLERADKNRAHQVSKNRRSVDQRLELLTAYLEEHGGITRSEYVALVGVSRKIAIRDLNLFIEQEAIARCGGGRSVFYVRKPGF